MMALGDTNGRLVEQGDVGDAENAWVAPNLRAGLRVEGVDAGGVSGGVNDRACAVMRRDRCVPGFGHAGDLAGLGQSSAP